MLTSAPRSIFQTLPFDAKIGPDIAIILNIAIVINIDRYKTSIDIKHRSL